VSETNIIGTGTSQTESELSPIPTTMALTGRCGGGDGMEEEPVANHDLPLPMDLGGRPAHWHAYVAAGIPVAPMAGLGSDLAQLGPLAPVLGVGLAAAAVVAATRGGGERRHRGGISLSPRTRARLRLRPGPGFATRGQLYRHYGRWPARRIARWGRPSLSTRGRWLGPWEEYAIRHGRAQGWIHRWGVYSTFEDLTLVIAPPQEGKSQHAATMIVRAPGPVVVTSIRGDLIRDTAGLRQQRGWTWIFNPEQIGAYAGNMRWNLVKGCEDITTAVRRAGYMVEASEARGLSDAAFWQDWASMTLASCMHAAALMGGSMRDVYTWVMDRAEADHALYVLSEHEQAHPVARQVLHQLQTMDSERTRDSIITTLARTLRFMIHPEVAEMVCPVGQGFDFEKFLSSQDTVYLVSSTDSSTPTAPIFSAFLAEMQATAHALGSKYRTEDGQVASRLDPPLTIVGDELANTAPVPVDRWASWAAGTGIVIIAYFQTWSRVQERWGRHGAEALWGSCKVKIIGSGVTEDEVLSRMSRLIGKTDVREADETYLDRWGHEKRRTRWAEVDIMPASEIRRIPPGKALVLRSGAPAPTIVTLEAIRKTREYKQWVKAGSPVDGLWPVEPRQVPTPRPELAIWGTAATQPDPEQQVDEIAARRARRQSAAAMPPPLNLPPRPAPAAEQKPDTDAPSNWSPWGHAGGSA